MSLYSEYIRERTNDDVFETEAGFATYRYMDEHTVYIVDIFVAQNARKIGLASDMADSIVRKAKEKGCKQLIGTVVPSTKGATNSLKVLLAYGMTLQSASNDLIVLRKDI